MEPWELILVKFELNTAMFIQERVFENVAYKMLALS